MDQHQAYVLSCRKWKKYFTFGFRNIYMPQKIFHLVGLLGLHLDWDCVPEHENCDISVAEDREDISEVSKD